MPTSKGGEMFSIDKDGKRQDAHIHNVILSTPGANERVDQRYLEGLKARGYPADMITRITKEFAGQQQEEPPKMASGGETSFFEHSAYRNLAHEGMIHSPIAGRTDKIPMKVRVGSYVFPADVVSGIGQGNSLAGANALYKMFQMGPYGFPSKPIATPHVNFGRRGRFAEGGETAGEDGTTDIIAAGGEFVATPEAVAKLGGGNLKHGHDIADHLVLHIRKKTIDEMKKLKGPKRS